ncbi:ABC transporter permease [Streptomyces radicis]|uniref:Transport permease protein n=1 Tax=Streptomyces radicis TaxID=1750517 RepID=A0A3A9WCS0_9ACTN|nr:ABC transporter permease [Streptomyces radicis]RKN10570.1 ABC transporter permease [Streptomyces radicis]RKN24830.1 ABC transporter permease [Streptomyces radicis]
MSETTHDSAPPRDVPLAELAARHGLSVSGARPSLPQYVRQLWGRRHFIVAFSQAKLTAQYSQAKLGQLWQVFTPLLNALVYFLIFGVLLGGRGGMDNSEYIPFLVTGVFVFTFTQASVLAGVKSISGNLGLVRALHFPRASLPISFSLQQLQQLLFSMAILVVIVVSFGHMPSFAWLLVVPVLALQFVFNAGLAMVMARWGSSTPDLAQLMPFILRTWMYASGVMFPLRHMVETRANWPSWVADVLSANPAAVYMDLVRYALIDGDYRDTIPAATGLYALGWALVVGIGGFLYFWKAEERYGRG